MKCRAEILRSGYYTGKRCKREATFVVSVDGGIERELCTQHKNVWAKANWYAVDHDRAHIDPAPEWRPSTEV